MNNTIQHDPTTKTIYSVQVNNPFLIDVFSMNVSGWIFFRNRTPDIAFTVLFEFVWFEKQSDSEV